MRQRGFSLIELLIVVAIILIIAAIAIPNLLRARIRANEASAVSSVRTVNTAQVTYASTYPTEGYASDLATLGAPTGGGQVDSSHAGLLDWVLGCATQPCPKSGYLFSIDIGTSTPPISEYKVTAVPKQVGATGERGFCSNNMNPIQYDPAGSTNCTKDLQ
ncbi:MAG: prepilin-type N-terminal cleavage/methylation domain-containing protein [Acidobacteriaceae bacterium]